MANIAQSVNVISPLLTTATGVVRQTTWWPLLLFSRYMRGWTLGVHVRCGSYAGPTKPAWLRDTLEDGAPWLDVSASVDEAGLVSLVVVNIHDEHDCATIVKGADAALEKKVQVFCVTASTVQATNTAEKQEVSIQESTWDGQGTFVFPKHSMTMLRWKAVV
ncbi:hypothetical protein VTK73DRAFT_3401 [Phialemonium thermophilum]|uniref:Alpha-L-arabinofuranosidase C-terminal domain-containing protein n=1 Tax=Phialemonium thermophilum TaxID=223376 RepID=A0ABR3X021_9PEZI